MKVLLGGGDGGAAKREAANVEAMEALENVNSPTTPGGSPLLQRLDQLEQQMSTLEEKYSPEGLAKGVHSPVTPSSLLGSPTTPSSLEKRCRPAKAVLEEAEAKGTLVERVQRLEKRIGQHSMDLDKTFSSGRFSSTRFGSNRFDPKHLEPHYLQETSKLAEAEQPRTQTLESGKATSEEVLPQAHTETAAPETLVTEVSMKELQDETPELAPVSDASVSPTEETASMQFSKVSMKGLQDETQDLAPVSDASISPTEETALMQSSETVPAKPLLVDEPPTEVPPVTSNDPILDSATSERSVASNSVTAASAESATELEMKNAETSKANHTPATAAEEPLVAVTKEEPLMQGNLGGSTVGKQLDDSMKESIAKAQEEKPMKVVEKPVAQAVTPPPASDHGYISKPQALAKQEKKRRFKNLRERYRLMFKNKKEIKSLT